MNLINYITIIVWFSPLIYLLFMIGGLLYNRKFKGEHSKKRDVDLILFQIPTIGNNTLVNEAFQIIKNYDLPLPLETWVIIEEGDDKNYVADKIVTVPKSFVCEDLYKSRALEYARQYRRRLVDQCELTGNYLLLQCDDDSLPSKEYVEECLGLDADLMIGTMKPRSKGLWNTILDYERSVACGLFCNFFTNIQRPVFAHGEAICVTSEVDSTITYDLSDGWYNGTMKLVSSEDLYYFHKASNNNFTLYNSEKPVYISPPITFKDAVKQRRRWIWGHINIVRYGFLPFINRLRLVLVEFSGLLIYFFSTLGIPLHTLGLIRIPPPLVALSWFTLILWHGMRGLLIGKVMGLKHALIGILTSYLSVTLNFIVHAIGVLMGDPKRFEVIEKA